VASDKVDAATYGAFNRAVREAVRRISANKGAYLHCASSTIGKTGTPRSRCCGRRTFARAEIVVCDPAPFPATKCSAPPTG
jgi:hypothetical protein